MGDEIFHRFWGIFFKQHRPDGAKAFHLNHRHGKGIVIGRRRIGAVRIFHKLLRLAFPAAGKARRRKEKA